MNIQTPEFLDKYEVIKLESNLKKELEIPSEINGKKCTIFVEYKHIKKGNIEDEKFLGIDVPEAPTPDGIPGVYCNFGYNSILKSSFKVLKGRKDYYQNPEIEKIFVKDIQPILDKILPDYMLQLVKQK